MAWTVEDDLDLVETTLSTLDVGKWTDIAFSLQNYVVRDVFDQHKITTSSGKDIDVNIRHSNSSTFRWVKLGQEDQTSIDDHTTSGTVPWRHNNVNYAFDRRALRMNRGKSRIRDYVLQKRAAAFGDWAESMESAFWSKPASSSDDTTMFGVFYWLKYNATTGFNGGAATGFTGGPAGISPTTYPNWKNFTAKYTNITKPDLVTLMRQAYVKTKFKPPLPANLVGGRPNDGARAPMSYGIYLPYSVLAGLETIGEQQNENLGKDIASMDGMTMFRNIPLTWVPTLDSTTGAPVIGINWNHFRIECLADWDFVEEPQRQAPNQHTVMVVHMDSTLNTVCTDRRAHFLIATADPYA